MEYSFPHYLHSKQTVDDRALNKGVFAALKANLPPAPFSVIEIGAGIGTMLTRLIEWGLLTNADYLALDEMDENIAYASEWIPKWAESAGLRVEKSQRIRFDCEIRRGIFASLSSAQTFSISSKRIRPNRIC